MTKKPKRGARKWTNPDDAPTLPAEFFTRGQVAVGRRILRPATGVLVNKGGRPRIANPKKPVSLRLDTDVLAFFRKRGRGWQTRINDALRHAAKLKTPRV